MGRIIGLLIAECGLIYVRASSAPFVPVWSFWWWAWILATVGVAWCGGMVTQAVAVERGWWIKAAPHTHRQRRN